MVNQCASSTCSPELAAAFSEANCSDIDASAPSSGSHTPKPCLWHDKTMEPSRLSRFGQTCRTLTDDLGADVLTWWLVGFPVRTFQQPETETGSKETDQACGQSLRGSLAKFDPDSFSWKTVQLSLFEDLGQSLVTWPRWGLMLHGVCWELTSPVSTTGATESGLLPTVLASDWKGGTTAARKDNGKLRFDQWRDYIKLKHGMTYPHPTHSELRMGWPQEWTDLKPLGMDKFRAWRQQHSASYQEV